MNNGCTRIPRDPSKKITPSCSSVVEYMQAHTQVLYKFSCANNIMCRYLHCTSSVFAYRPRAIVLPALSLSRIIIDSAHGFMISRFIVSSTVLVRYRLLYLPVVKHIFCAVQRRVTTDGRMRTTRAMYTGHDRYTFGECDVATCYCVTVKSTKRCGFSYNVL